MKTLTYKQYRDLAKIFWEAQASDGHRSDGQEQAERLILEQAVDFRAYAELVESSRICDLSTKADSLERLTGLVAEVGELFGEMQKACRKGEDLNDERFTNELGDVFYYITAVMNMHGISLNDVVNASINKICERRGIDKRTYLFDDEITTEGNTDDI